MPLYVKDREVSELAERLATQKNRSKTEAAKEALRSVLARVGSPLPPDVGPEHISPSAQQILDCAAALRRKYPAKGEGLPVTKEWIDSLYED